MADDKPAAGELASGAAPHMLSTAEFGEQRFVQTSMKSAYLWSLTEHDHHIEQLAVNLLVDEINHLRHAWELRTFFQRGENEDVDLLVAQPVGLGDFERDRLNTQRPCASPRSIARIVSWLPT